MNTVVCSNKLTEIIEGCYMKNPKQQELLYRMYAGRMLGICMRYASNQTEAEDILQTGFIKVFRKIDTYRNNGPIEGWIRRIMINTGIEYYRRRQRTISGCNIDIERDDFIHPAYNGNSELEVKDLLKFVQRLPSNYQTVFTLYAIEGYSHKEISGTLNISELASRANLCRAREMLKKAILKTTIREMRYLAC